jgi:hypothetical protein
LRALLRDTGDGVRVIVRLMQLGIKSGFEGRLRAIAQIDTDITPRLAASTSRSSTRPVGHACRCRPADSHSISSFSPATSTRSSSRLPLAGTRARV